jgi:O-antigen/teichoic acid export membrane protein
LLLAGLFVLQTRHKLTPLPVFLLLGFAGLCAALLIFHKLQIGLDETRPCTVNWLSTAAENWRYGRWSLGGAVCLASLGQTPLLLAPVFLGLAAAGKLFALQIPALLMLQCSAAAAMLLLPEFARQYGEANTDRIRQLAHRVSLSLAGASLLFAALFYFNAAPVERFLFGGKFAHDAWLIPVFMLTPLSAGLASGYSMALRAMQRPHFDRLATRIAAAVSVQTAFLFIPLWGLAGAAISMASGFVTHSAVVYFCFRQAVANDRKEFASQPVEEITPLEQFNL